MENLAKSMISLPWATFLFGVKQAATLANLQSSEQPMQEATDALNASAESTKQQLRGLFQSTFEAGNRLQHGMVDMMFGIVTFNFRR